MSKAAKIGPWGGPGGDEKNVQVMPGRLASVTIHSGQRRTHHPSCPGHCPGLPAFRSYSGSATDSGDTIDAISFTYIGTDYIEHSEGPWGRTLNTKSTITLDPTDYVTEISGTFGTAFDNDCVVTSLKISTFKEKNHKTYGKPNGTPFHIPVRDGGRVVGFFGRSGDMLDAIGVYVAP